MVGGYARHHKHGALRRGRNIGTGSRRPQAAPAPGGRPGVVRYLARGRGHPARARPDRGEEASPDHRRQQLPARLLALPARRPLPASQGRKGARGVPRLDRVLPQVRRAHRPAAHREGGDSLRRQLAARVLHPRREHRREAPAVHRALRRLRHAEGAAVPARHTGSRAARVLLPAGRRSGMGEVIRFRGILLRHDYEVVGSACLDYLETRPDVDANRIAVIALSLGGYFAPRCAAFDKRYKACIAWGSMFDFHAMWMRVLERNKNLQAKGAPLSVPAEHLMWVFGVKTLEEGLKKVEPFNLDGIAQELECPFLLLHGTNDEQVPLSDAETLFKAVGSKDKTFRVFTPEEGGAQHCQRDYLTLACDTMFDWLEEKLKR